jgi:hypothetical protein
MPSQRRWDWNIPSLIGILGLMLSLMGYVIANDRRQTKTEGDVEILRTVDKGMIDHTQAVEQVAVRDRAEMRDDIKEIKQILLKDRRR